MKIMHIRERDIIATRHHGRRCRNLHALGLHHVMYCPNGSARTWVFYSRKRLYLTLDGATPSKDETASCEWYSLLRARL